MKRKDLQDRTAALVNETHDALQTVYDELNKGQRKKLLKNENIKALFERYEIDTEENS